MKFPECEFENPEGMQFCLRRFASKRAEDHFNKAIEVAREIGAKATLASACLGLGHLHKAKGRKDRARECISEAIDLFGQCEADLHLKKAREALENLG